MSREIKFRAWYKPEGKMYQVKALYLAGEVPYVEWRHFEARPVDERIELMQFTGIKDCKGQEIWEGDIIKAKTPFDHWQDQVSIVKYIGGTWNYSDALQAWNDKPERDWEVIGNIYEHTGLLAKEVSS